MQQMEPTIPIQWPPFLRRSSRNRGLISHQPAKDTGKGRFVQVRYLLCTDRGEWREDGQGRQSRGTNIKQPWTYACAWRCRQGILSTRGSMGDLRFLISTTQQWLQQAMQEVQQDGTRHAMGSRSATHHNKVIHPWDGTHLYRDQEPLFAASIGDACTPL